MQLIEKPEEFSKRFARWNGGEDLRGELMASEKPTTQPTTKPTTKPAKVKRKQRRG